MRARLIGISAAFGLLSSATLAADLPNAKGPAIFAPPPPPLLSWTGFYIGGNAGAAWGDFRNTYVAPGPAFPNFAAADAVAISANGSNRLRPVGFTGGLQAGYNYQISAFVLGIETDFDYLGLHASTGGTFTTPLAGPQISSTSVSTGWLYTLRPRLGITVGPALIYATGGLAVAEERIDETNTFPAVNTGSDIFAAARARAGWTVGGGVEYRIDDHWSVKAEYLYARFDSFNGTSISNTPFAAVTAPIYYSHHVDLDTQIARVGVNYRFDMFAPPAPVVAKY